MPAPHPACTPRLACAPRPTLRTGAWWMLNTTRRGAPARPGRVVETTCRQRSQQAITLAKAVLERAGQPPTHHPGSGSPGACGPAASAAAGNAAACTQLSAPSCWYSPPPSLHLQRHLRALRPLQNLFGPVHAPAGCRGGGYGGSAGWRCACHPQLPPAVATQQQQHSLVSLRPPPPRPSHEAVHLPLVHQLQLGGVPQLVVRLAVLQLLPATRSRPTHTSLSTLCLLSACPHSPCQQPLVTSCHCLLPACRHSPGQQLLLAS